MYDVSASRTATGVSLWLIALHADALALAPARLELLPHDERERAGRFHFDCDRRAFIIAHAAAREILASYVNKHPCSLRFVAGKFGKPYLADPQCTSLQFNLSHSKELAVLAVSEDVPIGVDVEYIDAALEFEPLAARVFPPPALADFRQTPPAERRLCFFQWWARTEAVLKASGVGFAQNAVASELERFDWMDLQLAPYFSAALAWPRTYPAPHVQIFPHVPNINVLHTSH